MIESARGRNLPGLAGTWKHFSPKIVAMPTAKWIPNLRRDSTTTLQTFPYVPRQPSIFSASGQRLPNQSETPLSLTLPVKRATPALDTALKTAFKLP